MQAKTNMTAETRRIMRRWLWADYMLYDHFRAKLEGALNNYDISTMANRSVRCLKCNGGVICISIAFKATTILSSLNKVIVM